MGKKNKLISRWRKEERLLKIFEHEGKKGHWLRGISYKWQFHNGREHLLELAKANFYERDATEYRVKEYFGMNDAKRCDSDNYINKNHLIIWENIENDYDDWKKYMLEDSEYTEEDLTYEMYCDDKSNQLCDERANLDIEVDGVIVAFANLGLWDGHHNGAKSYGTNVKNILSSNCDLVDWYCDQHNVRCTAIHHDGTNTVLYRVAKNREQAERLINRIAYEDMTEEEFRKATRSLRPYVSKVYGWG